MQGYAVAKVRARRYEGHSWRWCTTRNGRSHTTGRHSPSRGITDRAFDFKALPFYIVSPMVPRPGKRAITAESFGKFLRWLSKDDERAVREYQVIRMKLVRYFVHKGCSDPDELFDKTVDVVVG